MHRRHQRTLAAIFDKRARGNLRWRDVEAMFRGVGAEIHERRGSSVIIELNGEVETVHRPHPRPECGKGLVKRMRRFLERAGVAP
ncbi:type II toxin-antitoxin system HicA family toxin [Candidatus Palauibacter sp.]|uniref:type II toxin-antitoxin system HicA family toxin n=1 Tax=Candidatus Palauibacter sp. TaxID=3101350 RepID=UPI003B0255F3